MVIEEFVFRHLCYIFVFRLCWVPGFPRLFLDRERQTNKNQNKRKKPEDEQTAQDPKAKNLLCFLTKKKNLPTPRIRNQKTQQKTRSKTELENMFWTNIISKNIRIIGRTAFLFTSRNQSNRHNLTHKNRNKQKTQNKRRNWKTNKETRNV